MSRAVTTLLIAVAAACAYACGKSTIRSFDGVACSTDPSEDPQYICSPTRDLVCISTFTVMIMNEREAMRWDGGVRPVYVCRLACSLDEECRQAGEICCPGHIYGKTYGKSRGCALVQDCHAIDAGVPEAPARPPDGGARPDGAGDAGDPDAPADAPSPPADGSAD